MELQTLEMLDELDELLLEQSKMESEFETLKNGKASSRLFSTLGVCSVL